MKKLATLSMFIFWLIFILSQPETVFAMSCDKFNSVLENKLIFLKQQSGSKIKAKAKDDTLFLINLLRVKYGLNSPNFGQHSKPKHAFGSKKTAPMPLGVTGHQTNSHCRLNPSVIEAYDNFIKLDLDEISSAFLSYDNSSTWKCDGTFKGSEKKACDLLQGNEENQADDNSWRRKPLPMKVYTPWWAPSHSNDQ